MLDSQVSTERIGTVSTPARSIWSTASSSISVPAGSTTSPLSGSRISTAGLRPANFLEHLFGNAVRAARPHVDDLVVLLALRDQAVLVLLLILLDLLLRLADQAAFLLGHDQIVLAERNAGLAGLLEPERHQTVAKDDRLLLAAMAVDLVDDVADL